MPCFALFSPKEQIKDDDVTITLQKNPRQMARFRVTGRLEEDGEEIIGNNLRFILQ